MYVIYGVIAIALAWFLYGIVKKLRYFSLVEKHLWGNGINPRTIEDKVGKQPYINSMSFLRQQGVTPDECARLLKLYVAHGVAEYMQSPPTDFQEYRLLQLLGYIEK